MVQHFQVSELVYFNAKFYSISTTVYLQVVAYLWLQSFTTIAQAILGLPWLSQREIYSQNCTSIA